MNLCYLAKFGKNKFNLWHMLLGAIAGGAHTARAHMCGSPLIEVIIRRIYRELIHVVKNLCVCVCVCVCALVPDKVSTIGLKLNVTLTAPF